MGLNVQPLIPVTLLTGFLGSGKTTVLNQLMQQPEMAQTLVIINEFGEAALDHQLVTSSQENLTQVMGSGCVCCTIRGDLVRALREVHTQFSGHNDRKFDRVIIETTGLADPAPIIHTLMTHPYIYSRYRIDGIVATIDLALGETTLNRFDEAVKQAAVADSLLLTKADLTDDDSRDRLISRLDQINPAAERYTVVDGQVNAEFVLDLGLFSVSGKAPDVEKWLNELAYQDSQIAQKHSHSNNHDHSHAHHHDHKSAAESRHDDQIRSFCFVVDDPISGDLLEAGFELLMAMLGERVLRVKAILNLVEREEPLVLHAVQHIMHPLTRLPDWPSNDRRSRFVFITKNIEKETVERIFRAFRHPSQAVSHQESTEKEQ